jgi:hypothetical protein
MRNPKAVERVQRILGANIKRRRIELDLTQVEIGARAHKGATKRSPQAPPEEGTP